MIGHRLPVMIKNRNNKLPLSSAQCMIRVPLKFHASCIRYDFQSTNNAIKIIYFTSETQNEWREYLMIMKSCYKNYFLSAISQRPIISIEEFLLYFFLSRIFSNHDWKLLLCKLTYLWLVLFVAAWWYYCACSMI